MPIITLMAIPDSYANEWRIEVYGLEDYDYQHLISILGRNQDIKVEQFGPQKLISALWNIEKSPDDMFSPPLKEITLLLNQLESLGFDMTGTSNVGTNWKDLPKGVLWTFRKNPSESN